MRTMSISLSEALYDRLKHLVPAKKVSKFVCLAIATELEKQEHNLAMAYKKVEQDYERQNLLSDWDIIDDFNKK